MSDTTIPHNRFVYITKHKSGGKYLYVSKKELSISKVAAWQNDETIVSIERPDVNMVIFID